MSDPRLSPFQSGTLNADELCRRLGSVEFKPSTVVRNLSVWLDGERIEFDRISRIATSCFFSLCRLQRPASLLFLSIKT